MHAAADLVAQTALDDLGDAIGVGLEAQRIDLLQHLTADLLAADLDERRKVRQRDGLAAVLAAGHLGDDLRGDVARGGEAVRALDERAGDDGAVLQHVLQVDQVAVVHVLREVVGVVEVDDALVVGFHHVGRQEQAHGDVLGDLACHVVALHGVDRGVLVRVLLLGFLVVALDERQDLVVSGVGLALERLVVAIDDVLARDGVTALRHDLVLDHVLDLFHGHGMARAAAEPLDAVRRQRDLVFGQALLGNDVPVGTLDGVDDLVDVERRLGAAALDDLHAAHTLLASRARCLAGALRITFIRAQKATQGMTCAFGNFMKICDLGAFGSLGRCPYHTLFRPKILCFIPLKNPWMGVWGCFPPWLENRETPGRHS